MIPHLQSETDAEPRIPTFFERLVEVGFRGEVRSDHSHRIVLATDNSVYQVKPAGVAFPRDAEDVVLAMRALSEPRFADVAITPRGGGTGTNGQSLTEGVIIDCSRYMNRILEIDPVRRVARVQAGVVKDQLNKALKPHGLFFAPELSTSNRATIGGMISTDACGQGSCLYGKTSNHVLGLRMVLSDGTDWWFRPVDDEELAKLQARADRIGEIYRQLESIEREQQDLIAATFPKLNRYLTGYDLAHLRRPDGRFDVSAILCGSEGTLGMILEAELNVLPIPARSALINIRYEDFNTALEDARHLVTLTVASVETVDEKVLGLAKGDVIWTRVAEFFSDEESAQANGINIAEILADDEEELELRLSAVLSDLGSKPMKGRVGYTIAKRPGDVEAIWAMRKRAVGLLGNAEGSARPVAFVEDTAVPPANLAAYIREFRALLDAEGLQYGMFGHVDAGVLHVRPALDLTRDEHLPLIRGISDKVVALTRKYGGVLWGEHGKGMRSEYVPEFFGALYPSLQAVKAAFDPGNQLNPGKIAAPETSKLKKIDEVPLRGQFDRVIPSDIRAALGNVAFCNGNGACFDVEEDNVMCPSYKATRDRRFSPKGRASLMREWLRLLAKDGVDPRIEAERARARKPFHVLVRAWNSLNPANRHDFSHEVREAMDTCLACKACAGQCPVKVSVPAFRSKFLELYHDRYLRPLKDPIVAAVETILPLAAWLRPVYNTAVTTVFGKMVMHLVGLTALPAIPATKLRRELARRGVDMASRDRIARLAPNERERAVVLVPDAFTATFDPEIILDAADLVHKMGFLPFMMGYHENGKALYVHGYLGRFAKTAATTSRHLHELAEMGVALVGLDPAMTLTYRSEYAEALPCQPKARVLLLQEWLYDNLERLHLAPEAKTSGSFKLLSHCTERSNLPRAASEWASIFDRLGINLSIADVGCCGMAGTFGHEVRNREISDALFAMSWADEIAAADRKAVLMATGYSCRSHAKWMRQVTLPHPVQVINGFAA
ncbi:D-2-hydroxyglutarate dehydrogenase YdiJ [Microvirga zambiensis]|uniref:D-2-hydroxyglutarate dehydrogenase YdiJ n=1 Tax=Microvirga zambiensis TaxID=1402137 RepID=UPI00191F8CDD|nr:FAD-binding and (Fe-S)-binding domain-containing protein [Microvirga zambiensis]